MNVRAKFPRAEFTNSITLNGRLFGTPSSRKAVIKLAPRVVCGDGLQFSVQASAAHFGCRPRNDDGPYTAVEVAMLSEYLPELEPYRLNEDGIPARDCVYRLVPIETVVGIINARGGLKA